MKDRMKKFCERNRDAIEGAAIGGTLLVCGIALGGAYICIKQLQGEHVESLTYYWDDSKDNPHEPFILAHLRNGTNRKFNMEIKTEKD